ncbi:hypothetical protein IV38_GL001544 [Lactobacillus selangorensis]|uniref:Transcription repressor NadR n=1 Tax=Lactobacillus selangorensis TaxID=81857 RepID=A0A0R2FIK4_9LACO|nr:transcription repressor NadR [Lactobacillus selangorensis]KRN28094.1 hypothetical protein IV38_GL001544 [Lactobacillus selangorensis]KRN31029.1 hypothetical protein IV40_GL001671 [Lactobacillus selangorensis]
MADNNKRRLELQNLLHASEAPITASHLAHRFGVSRQTIVGDIALLRASGEKIVPTPRGYEYAPAEQHVIKLVCRHFPDQTADEMSLVVNHGGTIKDVEIAHPLYGILVGQLNVSSLADVKSFVTKMQADDGHLLSELTNGIHTHTIMADTAAQIDEIRAALDQAGYLYQ